MSVYSVPTGAPGTAPGCARCGRGRAAGRATMMHGAQNRKIWTSYQNGSEQLPGRCRRTPRASKNDACTLCQPDVFGISHTSSADDDHRRVDGDGDGALRAGGARSAGAACRGSRRTPAARRRRRGGHPASMSGTSPPSVIHCVGDRVEDAVLAQVASASLTHSASGLSLANSMPHGSPPRPSTGTGRRPARPPARRRPCRCRSAGRRRSRRSAWCRSPLAAGVVVETNGSDVGLSTSWTNVRLVVPAATPIFSAGSRLPRWPSRRGSRRAEDRLVRR